MNAIKVLKLQRCDRAFIRSAQRAQRAMLEAMIARALILPFDEAAPLMRKLLNHDFKLVWRKDVTKWCMRHAKELQAYCDRERQHDPSF